MAPKQNPLAKKERNAVQRPGKPTALIRLYFHKSFSGKHEPAEPPRIGLRVPLGYGAERIPRKVREVVKSRVLSDKAVGEAMESDNVKLALTTSLEIPSMPWATLPLDGTPRLASVGDVFENGEKMVADAHVSLSLHSAEAPQPQDLVENITNPSKLKCLRIGYMPVFDPGYQDVGETRKEGRRDGPGYCQPLLVWFDETLRTIKLTKIHAFELGEICIGDINESEKWNQQKFTHDFFSRGHFTYFRERGYGFQKFKSRLRQHIDENWGNFTTGMPFLPTFCFNKFDPTEHRLGLTTYPKKGIDVAVRCVNHYEADNKLKDLSFRRDIRLVIMKEDTMDDIREFINDEINAKETEDGVKIDSARLFERQHQDRWEWQLWVMPETLRKLYRFEDGSIARFLNEQKGSRPKEKMVYMEAHVVPKK